MPSTGLGPEHNIVIKKSGDFQVALGHTRSHIGEHWLLFSVLPFLIRDASVWPETDMVPSAWHMVHPIASHPSSWQLLSLGCLKFSLLPCFSVGQNYCKTLYGIFVSMTRGVPVIFIWWKPRMPNILQCPGQSPVVKSYPTSCQLPNAPPELPID